MMLTEQRIKTEILYGSPNASYWYAWQEDDDDGWDWGTEDRDNAIKTMQDKTEIVRIAVIDSTNNCVACITRDDI